MAKAEIKIDTIDPHSTYFIITFRFKYKAGFMIRDNSIRMYYSLTPEIASGTPYYVIDTLNPSDRVINHKIENGWEVVTCQIPGPNDTPLNANTQYWLRSWLQLYKDDGDNGTKYKKYRGPKNPTDRYTQSSVPNQELFLVQKYKNPYLNEDDETEYETEWVDFTKYIVAPTYDINYVDVEETWEDANYVTHLIVPRTKIQGSLELYFSSRLEYNNFLNLIKRNRTVNGKGYIRLRVQVNNELDEINEFQNYSDLELEAQRCIQHEGDFFMKFENNPWAEPYYGHYDKYEPIRIEITEA